MPIQLDGRNKEELERKPSLLPESGKERPSVEGAPESLTRKKNTHTSVSMTYPNVRQELALDNIQEVLSIIMDSLEAARSSLSNEGIMHSASFNRLQKDIRERVVSEGNATAQMARLRKSILYLLDRMERDGIVLVGELEQAMPQIPTPVTPAPMPAQGDLTKILFLAANPMDTTRLRIGEEVNRIEEKLRRSPFRDLFQLKQKWAVTADSMVDAMLDESPNIVHFSGHGEKKGIVLDDGDGSSFIVDGDGLHGLFSLFKEVRCVVLNACYAAEQARMIGQHVEYVIGMKETVADETAIDFAARFYSGMAAGRDIELSFHISLATIRLKGLPDEDVPVLIKNGKVVELKPNRL